ncbi:MAG TPA: L-histidine N(alpha)-methyltransferase [Acetobacteraceae bacterium]|nr:L-histidine N(alpha)-methyltransferase [Acetobacteraceae bacterium]
MPEGDFKLAPARTSVVDEALAGLTASRKSLPPKFFYDRTGCELFGAITGLPEYYPTRTERLILGGCMPELAALTPQGAALVEYGASDEGKAAILLDALDLAAYVPIDIAHEALEGLRRRMLRSHPGLPVHPLAADFTDDSCPFSLPRAVRGLPVLGFFPGSTIGNFDPLAARMLLASMRKTLGQGAALLIGVDLRKPEEILVPAYDDAEGVTAAFNLNLLARLNREADADFDLGGFAHRAIWNGKESRIEMHLESLAEQTVHVAGVPVSFRQGETIHTENSYKYTPQRFVSLAAEAGWHGARMWTDPDRLFSVHLLR